MSPDPTLFASSNLSVAWGRLFLHAMKRTGSIAPAVVSIAGFSDVLPGEIVDIRAALDETLATPRKSKSGKLLKQLNPVAVSALTIFPYDMWLRRGKPSVVPFSKTCLHRLLPRMKARNRQNQHGTYFERMMRFVGVKNRSIETLNQLEFVVDRLNDRKERWPRQSALQISCIDPVKDDTRQPVRGFPCLQQVSVTYDKDGALTLNAYYPTQYIVDRAYGNYLGLCHLGHFIANETRMRFSRLNCFVGRPELGTVSKTGLWPLARKVEEHLSAHE